MLVQTPQRTKGCVRGVTRPDRTVDGHGGEVDGVATSVGKATGVERWTGVEAGACVAKRACIDRGPSVDDHSCIGVRSRPASSLQHGHAPGEIDLACRSEWGRLGRREFIHAST